MSRCRKCNKPIFWGRTENNKRIPIDMETVHGGNLVVELDGALVRVVNPRPDIKRHVSHFSTCPFADDFRKR
jgi:hypothetical protein